MLKIVFFCRCGHSDGTPYEPLREIPRETLLARARCSRCGRLGAADLRIIWFADAVPALQKPRLC